MSSVMAPKFHPLSPSTAFQYLKALLLTLWILENEYITESFLKSLYLNMEDITYSVNFKKFTKLHNLIFQKFACFLLISE